MTKETSVTVRTRGDVSIIDIKGDVTAQTGAPIEETYQKVTAGGATKLLLCFDKDSYINSGGIAVLIGIVSEGRKQGQVIRMTGLSAHFRKIFDMVGLTRYAQVFQSEETALEKF